jgi:AcrR family transcriptional regulator
MRQTASVTRALTRRPGRPLGGQLDIDRTAILDAAERVIGRDGARTSLEAVAAAAGVTKPIIYDRIGSRADLADALAERLAQRMLVASEEALAGKPFAHDALVAFIASNLSTVRTHRQLFLYVTGGSTEQTSLGRLALAKKSVTPLAQFLSDWRSAQGRRPDVAESWAYGLVGMLQMASLWVIGDEGQDPVTVAGHLADLLWSGLAAPPDGPR